MHRRFLILLLGLTIIGAAAGAWFTLQSTKRSSASLPAVPIGGPFTLVAHDGKTVTEADFKGQYTLVFFGYTFCPDVCPTSLQTVSEAMDLLGKQGEQVQPLFITVDPERDTFAMLAEYVSNFHPRLIGLSGSREQVAAAAKVYRVSFMKFFPPPGSLSGETDEEDEKDAKDDDGKEEAEDDDDYLMNHSAVVYLMGPDGKYLSHFSHQATPDAIAAKIREHL